MAPELKPRIEIMPETRLAGHRLEMSFVENRTRELWSGFMPRLGELSGRIGQDLYSVEVYPGTGFFSTFDPTRVFEKWACVPVAPKGNLPVGLEERYIPEGLYAVFRYVGKPSLAAPFFRTILTGWLPESGFILDDRPHLAVMGKAYLGEDPRSEEDIWIPVLPN